MSDALPKQSRVGREFRVRWQRDGHNSAYRIYQTEAAARRKIDGILALDSIRAETQRWEDMPSLVGTPVLQVREVSDWLEAEPAVDPVPSEAALAGVRDWAGVNDDLDQRVF